MAQLASGDPRYARGPQSSAVPMDHYDYPRTNEAAAAEVKAFYGGGGKAAVPLTGVRAAAVAASGTGLSDVISGTYDPRKYVGGVVPGDGWLEHRGRRVPPHVQASAMTGARRDLGEILTQTMDHGLDGVFGQTRPAAHTGDAWLEARGKRGASGGCLPAMPSGRRDLYEVLQQTAPVHDGRTTGDRWLEAGLKEGRRKGVPAAGDNRWDEIDYARAKVKGEISKRLAPKNEWNGPC